MKSNEIKNDSDNGNNNNKVNVLSSIIIIITKLNPSNQSIKEKKNQLIISDKEMRTHIKANGINCNR